MRKISGDTNAPVRTRPAQLWEGSRPPSEDEMGEEICEEAMIVSG
jgi:hypothetical protein